MFERFTGPAREVVQSASALSEELGHRHIGTEHILLALLGDGAGEARAVLTHAGLTSERVQADIERLVRADGLSDADAEALKAIGIDVSAVRAKLEEAFGPGVLAPQPQEIRYGLFRRRRRHTRFAPRARKVLELSLREALRLKHGFIAPEHILLGVVREGRGLGAKIMADAGVDFEEIRRGAEAALRQPA